MAAELIIRPSLNDHDAVADVLAAGAPSMRGRPLIDRLVVDAHTAPQRPQFAESAAAAGIPFLVDPLTYLLQIDVRAEDKWAALPFGRALAMTPTALESATERRDFVASVVDFQLEQGATAIIPPYVYSQSPSDPWFNTGLQLLSETVEYLDEQDVRLPLVPVFCGLLRGVARPEPLNDAAERFLSLARQAEPSMIAVCVSPAGAPTDGYAKVSDVFNTAMRFRGAGTRVIAWRQGVYGLPLVAAGLDGYETGMGTGEQTNIARSMTARKPARPGQRPKRGGMSRGVFIEPLGRSVPQRVAQLLLGDVAMRPRVMCDDESCCPTVAATLDAPRQHSVRTRARMLQEVSAMPHRAWRVHQLARSSQDALTLATHANRLLAREGTPARVGATNLASLHRVLDELARAIDETRTA
jgi:hypothetical protein